MPAEIPILAKETKLSLVGISTDKSRRPCGRALRQTSTEFWVAKNETTKKCEVVDKKPDGKTLMEVGKKSYESKAAAEKAMKEYKECK